MIEPSDTALVTACRAGDADAWEALVLRYQRLIYAIPRRAGLSDESAADVFQRVWAKLVEHLDRIEQPERLSAWLMTTAKRETWRISRRERAAPISADDLQDEVGGLPDDALLPDEELVRLEEQHQVRTAILSLDDRCRTLLELLFYRDVAPSYDEIAVALGTRAGSIGPTRARCLEKLRLALEQFDRQN